MQETVNVRREINLAQASAMAARCGLRITCPRFCAAIVSTFARGAPLLLDRCRPWLWVLSSAGASRDSFGLHQRSWTYGNSGTGVPRGGVFIYSLITGHF